MAFYEVQVSPTAGQGAFARVLIPEGTLIINEMPLMTVLRALVSQIGVEKSYIYNQSSIYP